MYIYRSLFKEVGKESKIEAEAERIYIFEKFIASLIYENFIDINVFVLYYHFRNQVWKTDILRGMSVFIDGFSNGSIESYFL